MLTYKNVTAKTVIDHLSSDAPMLGLEVAFVTEINLIQAAKSELEGPLECLLQIKPSISNKSYSTKLVIRQSFNEHNLQELTGPEVFSIVSAVDNQLGKNFEDQIKVIPKIGDEIWRNLTFVKIVCVIVNQQIAECEVHGTLTKLNIMDNLISADNCTIKISFLDKKVSIDCSGSVPSVRI